MATSDTKQVLIDNVLNLLATHGPAQISMRKIAEAAGVQQSVIYHYFGGKDELLSQPFLAAQAQLRQALADLTWTEDTHELLRQRIRYHLDNGKYILPMLRYFMAYKEERKGEPGSYIPPQALYHIRQVIEQGVTEGIYESDDPEADAKVVVHALNGFVIEYYPHANDINEETVARIQSFIERALRKEGAMRASRKHTYDI
jgi:AcrR family transcriptional regulator